MALIQVSTWAIPPAERPIGLPFLAGEPLSNGIDPVVDRAPDDDMRGRLSERPISLACSQADAALAGVLGLGDEAFEDAGRRE